MTPRHPVLGGLLVGVLAGAALIAAVVAFAPIEPPVTGPGPSARGGAVGGSPSEPSSSPGDAAPTPAAGSTANPSDLAEPSEASEPSRSPGSSALPVAAEFMVGEPAPPLALPQLGGGTIDLAMLRGRPVWVTFMATWCPSCREELPRMALAAVRHAEAGLVVVAVDVAEDEGTVAAYVRDLGVDLPVALDGDGSAMRRWRVLALPVHFWIDHAGVVRFGALGGVGPDVLAEGLGTILPGVVEP
jgi:thiol-disulfide isomerase/thioredoxin